MPLSNRHHLIAALIALCAIGGTAVAEDTNMTPAKPATENTAAPATEDAQELAKKLANPIASLISVPLQSNFDCGIGPADDRCRYTLNVQPVIPISIGDDGNVISRTILPITYQDDIFPGAGDQFGLGDTVQNLFFSPKAPSSFGGLIWGARRPVFLIPTATDDLLGSEKFGIGPTLVVLKQSGPWTVAPSPTTSGPWPATTTAPTSAQPSCSPSSPTRHRTPGRSRSTRKRPTTGRASSGRCRSTPR